MNNINFFNEQTFIDALKSFFKALRVPIDYLADEPAAPADILSERFNPNNEAHKLINDVYALGVVNDAVFENKKADTFQNIDQIREIKSDYDGLLIFGVTLKERENGLLPTRSHLAEIARAFNREFHYTPVVVVFKYNEHIAFANTERLKYKQEWREGEKTGKVTMLRDISIRNPHSGHVRILKELAIPTSDNKKVDSFTKLYSYWQDVLNVSILNKAFYQELSNWYFWAIKHVIFPGQPTAETAMQEDKELQDLLHEHRATNVIRMLTRLLFVWFLKEKKLIPDELFDIDKLQKDILNDIQPFHENGLFVERNYESVYYKAILQNLFFATLNCPIKPDGTDKRERGFRSETPGTHRGVDYLMRYKKHFKDPDAFLKKMNDVVPFLNGGLFECLDDKDNNIYIDGFSDNMTKGNHLVVPDYLFFGLEEETDISDVVGLTEKKYKQAAVKGLINILKSYKFTITENTPIEEEVALDPELLGRVFENLLASYNPETKTTARKQTGSFYTPREIVNYMVDESLIAYLNNSVPSNINKEDWDRELRNLISFDSTNPFENDGKNSRLIIEALSSCTILDPACGSGAFPMGILQKMVHILQKLDPDNEIWHEVQLEKAASESKAAFSIENKEEREKRLLEINEAFDQSLHDPDFARKLFLIENCIFGVDIQPIATQISKLRFFISLVVEQKVNPEKENFGIRPLPNLETKFVTANTLIGIEKEGSLFETEEIKQLERELKDTRSKLFSARTKETKTKYREKDKQLRTQIADKLIEQGYQLDSAQKLAQWDPYDQNASSPFFDPEWMFDIKEGFDVVIGNPPYVSVKNIEVRFKNYLKEHYKTASGQFDLYSCFIENGIRTLSGQGNLTFITSNTFLSNKDFKDLRKYLLSKTQIKSLVNLDENVFDTAQVDVAVINLLNGFNKNNYIKVYPNRNYFISNSFESVKQDYYFDESKNFEIRANIKLSEVKLIDEIDKCERVLDHFLDLPRGIEIGGNSDLIRRIKNSNDVPLLVGKSISQFKIKFDNLFITFNDYDKSNFKERIIYEQPKILIQRIRNLSLKQRIVATYDSNNYYCTNTLRIGLLKKRNDNSTRLLKSLVGVLNSLVVNFYFSRLFLNRDIYSYQLQRIPIPNFKEESNLSVLVDFLLYKHNDFLFHILNSYIFNLYFPNHMKERGIDVIDFVEQDIDKVMKGRDFEQLNDIEKEAVIEALHNKWSDPENEVVKRMAQFKEKSPDILKIIMEG